MTIFQVHPTPDYESVSWDSFVLDDGWGNSDHGYQNGDGHGSSRDGWFNGDGMSAGVIVLGSCYAL